MPSTKVTAATIAAALGTIAMWLLKTYAHVDVPDPVNVAGVALLTLVVSYLIPEVNPAPSAISTVREKGLT